MASHAINHCAVYTAPHQGCIGSKSIGSICGTTHCTACCTTNPQQQQLLLQPFMALWTLSGTSRVSQYQKKHPPTHTYRGHQSSLIYFLHLLRSVACSLFNLCVWQSFSSISLQVFFGLPLGLSPSTSYSIHFFTQSLSFFAAYARTITTCFAVLSETLSCGLMPHIHLTILIVAVWSATSFSFLMGQLSQILNESTITQINGVRAIPYVPCTSVVGPSLIAARGAVNTSLPTAADYIAHNYHQCDMAKFSKSSHFNTLPACDGWAYKWVHYNN